MLCVLNNRNCNMVHSNDNTVIRVLQLDVAGQTELNQVRFSI